MGKSKKNSREEDTVLGKLLKKLKKISDKVDKLSNKKNKEIADPVSRSGVAVRAMNADLEEVDVEKEDSISDGEP